MGRYEPCMCGALDCGSCGPLQGSHQCPLCREWGGGCEHYGEDGEPTPEAEAALRRMEEAEEAYWDAKIDEAFVRGDSEDDEIY